MTQYIDPNFKMAPCPINGDYEVVVVTDCNGGVEQVRRIEALAKGITNEMPIMKGKYPSLEGHHFFDQEALETNIHTYKNTRCPTCRHEIKSYAVSPLLTKHVTGQEIEGAFEKIEVKVEHAFHVEPLAQSVLSDTLIVCHLVLLEIATKGGALDDLPQGGVIALFREKDQAEWNGIIGQLRYSRGICQSIIDIGKGHPLLEELQKDIQETLTKFKDRQSPTGVTGKIMQDFVEELFKSHKTYGNYNRLIIFIGKKQPHAAAQIVMGGVRVPTHFNLEKIKRERLRTYKIQTIAGMILSLIFFYSVVRSTFQNVRRLLPSRK